MLFIDIPGGKNLKLDYAIFDMNGTLSVDGHIKESTKALLVRLADYLKIFVMTSDTFGVASKELEGLPIELKIISSNGSREIKYKFLQELGQENCVAVGNGFNDSLMLKNAALSIAVMMEEGVSSISLLNSDIVVKNIENAISLLLNYKRVVATLRD